MVRTALVVGAGFAGAVHARELAEAGFEVEVIDRRSHIAGNAYDFEHATGVRVHKYGPHLFHTSNTRVVDWLSRFTEWLPYEHRVVALTNNGLILPIPLNIESVSTFFGVALKTPDDIKSFLASKALRRDSIQNAADHLYSVIGPELTDTFYGPYTKKMWGLELSEMDVSVVNRLQIRSDSEDRYFPNDIFQALPKYGYTELFQRIFDHKRIMMSLSTEFRKEMLNSFDFCFNSMPIDEFFDYELGDLPYRSIRFHLQEHGIEKSSSHVTVNYTNTGPFTRESWWHNMPGHFVRPGPLVVRTVEEPCDYRDNNFERYYPVKTHDRRFEKLYDAYKLMASRMKNVIFIGRCGTYQYLDMHQVINQSLVSCHRWLRGSQYF